MNSDFEVSEGRLKGLIARAERERKSFTQARARAKLLADPGPELERIDATDPDAATGLDEKGPGEPASELDGGQESPSTPEEPEASTEAATAPTEDSHDS